MTDSDHMPVVAVYKGVDIHDFQSQVRIEQIVIPEIDRVFSMTDSEDLLAFLRDNAHAPEARLAAEQRLLAPAEKAQDRHRAARVDPKLVRASAAGLDSFRWVDPPHYNSLLHISPPGAPQAVARPEPYLSALLEEKAAREEAGRRRYEQMRDAAKGAR